MLKKTEKEGVYKDTKSGALINKNKDRLSAYKMQKQKMREANETAATVKMLQTEIDTLKQDNEQLKSEFKKLKSAVNALKKISE
jgi:FtsZ-binding cell division protein ZapB